MRKSPGNLSASGRDNLDFTFEAAKAAATGAQQEPGVTSRTK